MNVICEPDSRRRADLQAWFDSNGIGHMELLPTTSSSAGSSKTNPGIPSPLLVAVKELGVIAVTASPWRPIEGGGACSLLYDETFRSSLAFERRSHVPGWFAVHGPTPEDWLCIRTIRAFEVGELVLDGMEQRLDICFSEFAFLYSANGVCELHPCRPKLPDRPQEPDSAVQPKSRGKSSNPHFAPVKVLIRKSTRRLAERKWKDETGNDLSDLIERLLDDYSGDTTR